MQENSDSKVNWEAVYDAYLPRIYNFFIYLVGCRLVAEDLTATVFEKAWRYRHRYQANLGAFSTWLFTLAKNVARDYFRRRNREIPLEHLDCLRDPDLVEEVEEIVTREEERTCLAMLLAQLPPREQELVALKYGANLTNREIARLTGLSETNVGTILHRTIQRLRAQWEDHSER